MLPAVAMILAPLVAHAQDCVPGWLTEVFCQPGTNERINTVASGVVGDGPTLLYAGGRFDAAGCEDASGLAVWDGVAWSELAGGVNGEVFELMAFDDGTGSALYVGGSFTRAGGVPAENIAKWDGQEWSPMGGGIQGNVQAMAVYDDGRGPALYVAGGFEDADGQRVNNITRWSGTRWEPVAGGVTSAGPLWASALKVFDDGTGEALYVGGRFETAGSQPARGIARWDGFEWSALGTGTTGSVAAIDVYDDGTGPALYAAGNFPLMGGRLCENIARWDGAEWAPLGTVDGVGTNGHVNTLRVVEEDGQSMLLVGGVMARAGIADVAGIARWNGSAWSSLAEGLDRTPGPASANDMALHDDGSGLNLFVVGTMDRAGTRPVRNVALWDGEQWRSEASTQTSLDGPVAAMVTFDEGSGERLIAGGDFEIGGGEFSRGIARWDGTRWSAVQDDGFESLNGIVRALAVFDDGFGPALYVGGVFQRAGEVDAFNIARWTGRTWESFGEGVNGPVLALRVFDDGTGPGLYVGGDFTKAGDVTVNNIARWNGVDWSPLGTTGTPGVSDFVADMAVFDDGRGPALFVTGSFLEAGEQIVDHIVRWDGTDWEALEGPMGFGLDRSGSGGVDGHALATFDDGQGEALYVGGEFDVAGGRVVNRIARWDGTDWEALEGPAGIGVGNTEIDALLSFDDGTGPALYAGGLFQTAGGIAAGNIARWDGQRWEPMPTATGAGLGTGVDSEVWALATFDDGNGRHLFAGGRFTQSSGSPTDYTAQWIACPAICEADFDGDGDLTLFDFLAFSNAFHVGDPRADFDGDGSFTLFDFLLFSNEFDAGCP